MNVCHDGFVTTTCMNVCHNGFVTTECMNVCHDVWKVSVSGLWVSGVLRSEKVIAEHSGNTASNPVSTLRFEINCHFLDPDP